MKRLILAMLLTTPALAAEVPAQVCEALCVGNFGPWLESLGRVKITATTRREAWIDAQELCDSRGRRAGYGDAVLVEGGFSITDWRVRYGRRYREWGRLVEGHLARPHRSCRSEIVPEEELETYQGDEPLGG